MSKDQTTQIDWRALSEKTGYRVLTTPNGFTVNADCIAVVKMLKASERLPRHVVLIGYESQLAEVYEDVDDFFHIATEVHRQSAIRRLKSGQEPQEPR